jgi:hypothetical protein
MDISRCNKEWKEENEESALEFQVLGAEFRVNNELLGIISNRVSKQQHQTPPVSIAIDSTTDVRYCSLSMVSVLHVGLGAPENNVDK